MKLRERSVCVATVVVSAVIGILGLYSVVMPKFDLYAAVEQAGGNVGVELLVPEWSPKFVRELRGEYSHFAGVVFPCLSG